MNDREAIGKQWGSNRGYGRGTMRDAGNPNRFPRLQAALHDRFPIASLIKQQSYFEQSIQI